jgi:hypothetical protein
MMGVLMGAVTLRIKIAHAGQSKQVKSSAFYYHKAQLHEKESHFFRQPHIARSEAPHDRRITFKP